MYWVMLAALLALLWTFRSCGTSEESPERAPPRTYTIEGLNACRQALRPYADYPATLKFPFGRHGGELHDDGTQTIQQWFTADTTFGVPVEYVAQCRIAAGGERATVNWIRQGW
jgi:hypothetical protein